MRLFWLLLVPVPLLAFGGSRLTPGTIHCVFRKPVEVGASVTGRVGEIPFFSTLERYVFGIQNAIYNGSPSHFFIWHYRQIEKEEFDKPQYKFGSNRSQNLAHAITNKLEHSGTGQIEHLLDGDNRQSFETASILLGVDLFYWDAIWGLCGYGMAKMRQVSIKGVGKKRARMDTEYQIERLIARAKAAKKTLVLGTLPYEDPNKVLINSDVTGVQGFWYPQKYQCVRSINETLKQRCLVKDGCYLFDMGALARDLNEGKMLHVESEKQDIDLYQARPDGVHLSYLGSKAAAERMVELFEKNPPSCGTGTSPAGAGVSPEGDAGDAR